jgi:uncharacterized phiE125 gp8 family phage protein
MLTVTPIVTSAPAIEPVTLTQAKTHCRLDPDFDADDTYLNGLIAVARRQVENYCGRALITQTVTLTADAFPRSRPGGRWEWDGVRQFDDPAMRLPMGKARSVTSVAYVDANGDTQAMSSSAYHATLASEPARVSPAYGTCWPVTRCQTGAVTVVYVAGYGDTAASVPAEIRHAMLLLVGHLYEQRQPLNIGNIVNALPFTIEALLSSYRVFA